MKNIYIYISGACNLRCHYCFARRNHSNRQIMTTATAEATVDWFIKWLGREKEGHICFFGGEPLLNWAGLTFAVDYARQQARRLKKKISFSVTTNGTLFTREKAAFLRKHGFGILVSVDSHRPALQTRLRPACDGEDSFRPVVEGLKLFKKPAKILLRATLNSQNTDLVGYIKYFSKFPAVGDFAFVEEYPGGGAARQRRAVEAYKQAWDKYLAYIFKNWEKGNIIDPRALLGAARACRLIGKRAVPKYCCGAGENNLAVAANGDIYFCQNFVGLPKFRLGNVARGIDREKQRRWQRAATFANRKGCQKCGAKTVCQGECHYINYAATGRIDRPDSLSCEIQKYRLGLGQKLIDKIDELIAA
ncbi:MAG: radical SAM protein [Candidatus Margulisiibacteriota bacterium]